MRLSYFILYYLIVLPVLGENLMKTKIRTIASDKRSLYFEGGVFSHSTDNPSVKLKDIRRHFPNGGQGEDPYERIVFDFSGSPLPGVYSNLSSKVNTLYMDFFNTAMDSDQRFPGQARYVKNANFIPDTEALSVELKFKTKVSAEIFYLNSPNRLVVDIKKSTEESSGASN